MPFDGVFTHAMSHELNHKLLNGRVSKISEPYPNEVILTIRANRKNYQLLLSANPTYARIQTTEIPFSNPSNPTNFAMTLRKHLRGSLLVKLHQIQNDRIIHLHFKVLNELGDYKELILVCEIMARHSNVILVDASDNTIIDCIKRVSKTQNRYRTLLPGFKYVNPPKQNLVNPFALTDSQMDKVKTINSQFPNVEVLARHLQSYLQGLSNLSANALAHALHQPKEAVPSAFRNFFLKFDAPEPVIGTDSDDKLQFSPSEYVQVKPEKSFKTLSEMLDYFYQAKVQHERVRELGSQLIKIKNNELKKNKRKLHKLTQTLSESEHAEKFRIKGEILTTFLPSVQSGSQEVRLPNFYDNNKIVSIPLDPSLSASKNAQRYFKKYDKKKSAKKYVEEQIANTKREIDYFENISDQLELATPKDLSDIYAELKNGGYIKTKTKKKKRKSQASKPERFKSDDGSLILVGKNNLQNDTLTQKTADKRDTWLHTQNIHGSHVIIRDQDPSEKTIHQAAELAAYFSKARYSANVPVDYLKVKNVKKPSGTKPGFVTFRDQETIFVTPKKEIIDHLKQNAEKSNPQ